MYQNMVKSSLISGGHIRPGPDIAGYEKMTGFRPGPGPNMISGATLQSVSEKQYRQELYQHKFNLVFHNFLNAIFLSHFY